MSTFSEQISSNKAVIRFDVVGGPERTAVAEDMSFLNYRLGSVEVSHEITKEQPDIIWYYDEAVKSIRYENEQLILTSFWEEGELNKIMVTMLANQMDKEGLHPFHSSSVVYRGHGILLVGGENNHGKSMTQLEGCRRGASIFSTETTVMDHETGIALYGYYPAPGLEGLDSSGLLPVMALNVDNVDVNFFRIKPESLSAFVSQWEYRNSLSNWESDELLKMADLVYTGRFDLNPARNTREKLLLPLADIKPLQQPGVYVAVMNPAGRYSYSNAATLFTLSDIGVSAHRYHNRLDVFTQSLEDGAAQSGIDVQLLNTKGQTLAEAKSDAQGHVTLQNDDKDAALLLARKDGQTTLLDLKLPALDLAEFSIAGAPGFSKQLFMFGPRDLYRPGETVILNALLRDGDGKPLAEQPVKFEVVQPDGQVIRSLSANRSTVCISLPGRLIVGRRPVCGISAPAPATISRASGISTLKILCLSVWR